MRKVYAIAAIFMVASLGSTTLMAADLLGGASSRTSCTACGDQPQVVVGGCSGASDCGSNCGGCDSMCGTCHECKYKAYIASFGYFNCACRGSYKFPVPPQYTYHWPGMYSQQCMTEYTSPYRFPPLELPSFIPQESGPATVQPIVRNTSTGSAAVNPATIVPLTARRSSRPTPMSARLKQKYGIK
jgi:hypothetical protein